MNGTLPPLYSRWIAQLLGAQVSGEPRSTCHDCRMCKKPEIQATKDRSFQPGVKCCGYWPALPNFLVGAILTDTNPDFAGARAQFERAAITARTGPLGVAAPAIYNTFFALKAFGSSDSLRCPYYLEQDGGICGIWRYRNSQCSTWFCTFERGQTGYNFWKKLGELLKEIEERLAEWCMQQIRNTYGLVESESIWGAWIGNEREFYARCHELVADLSYEQVEQNAGGRVAALGKELVLVFQGQQDDSLPDLLKAGAYTSEMIGGGFSRVWAYSNYDPIDISDEILSILPRFEEGTVLDVQKRIREENGVVISDVLLHKLLDMRILIPVDQTQSI